MEDGLGAVAAPTHAGSVEAHTHEVAHGAFDNAAADRQVLASELLVAHPSCVLGEVVDDLLEDFTAVLVARAGDRCGVEQRHELPEDLEDLAGSERLLPLRDPRVELIALAVCATTDRFSSGPELLDSVEPVEALQGFWEKLLLEVPEHLGAVRQEQDLGEFLRAVPALFRFVTQPREERAIALEGRVDVLVDRAFELAVRIPLERVDGANRRDLRVLRLLSRSSSRPRVLSALRAPCMTPVARLRRAWLRSSSVLSAGDRWSALAVGFDDEDLAIVLGSGGLFEEGPCLLPGRIDHPQHRARARAPTEQAPKERPRLRERHHRAEPSEERDHGQREPGRQSKLPHQRQVAHTAGRVHPLPGGLQDLDLAESRADLCGLAARDLVPASLVLVASRTRLRGPTRQEQPHDGSRQTQASGPNLFLHLRRSPLGPLAERDDPAHSSLDFVACLLDSPHRGLRCGGRVSQPRLSTFGRPRLSITRSATARFRPDHEAGGGDCTHLSTGGAFVRCEACDCAWQAPTRHVNSIVATSTFAPQGYRAATRVEIASAGVVDAIVSERRLD